MVISLSDEEPRSRVLKASKDRLRETKEKNKIEELTNAIGDRRLRDLHDLVASLELESGWETVVRYLICAVQSQYSSPLITGPSKIRLEPLKVREMLFALFSCSGLEPIDYDTLALLQLLEQEESFARASTVFESHITNMAKEHIANGNILFFNLSNYSCSGIEGYRDVIEKTRNSQISKIRLFRTGAFVNIEPLWYTEFGRYALSGLAVKGTRISLSDFESVLSVLQVSSHTKSCLKKTLESNETHDILTLEYPLNENYRELLVLTINQDIKKLCTLGSRHTVPTIIARTRMAMDQYKSDESSNNYRELITCLTSHLLIRSVESVLVLEDILQLKNPRLTTLSALALGNFYHESAASLLIDVLCQTKDHNILHATNTALLNLFHKLPETTTLVFDKINSSTCTNIGHLKQIYKKISHQKRSYYEQ